MTTRESHRMLPAANGLETELHIWLARPPESISPDLQDDYPALLSVPELQRYGRFRFDADRRLYLAAHVLLRRCLSHYADVPPSDWQFIENQHGRPEIAAPLLPRPIRFNLSHTPGLAACIVVLGDDCGIDVEQISSRRDAAGIASRMFASSELRHLSSLEGDDYLRQFFIYWTLHEAYGKALGLGVSNIGKGYAFNDCGAGRYELDHLYKDGNSVNWQFSVLQPTDEHLLALAARSSGIQGRKVVVRWLTL